MREGGGNCLKFLTRGWNRKEGRGNKDFKKWGNLGREVGALKRGGWVLGIPLRTMKENFFEFFIVRQLCRFIDTILFLALIKPTFITTSAREFGAFLLLLLDLLEFCKNFGLKKPPLSFPFSLTYLSKDFGLLLSFSPLLPSLSSADLLLSQHFTQNQSSLSSHTSGKIYRLSELPYSFSISK